MNWFVSLVTESIEIIAIAVICFVIWLLFAFNHIKYLRVKKPVKDSKRESTCLPQPEPTPELFASRVGGLLDFYSDRAVAHASFLVASIFGLVTLSAIIQQLDFQLMLFPVPLFWLSVLLFFVFSYLGYYALIRFGFYARIADKLRERGLKWSETFRAIPYRQGTLKEYHLEEEEKQRKLLVLRRIISTERGILALVLLYWVLVFFFGSIVYSRFWTCFSDFLLWLAVLFTLTVFFVGISAMHVYLSAKTEKKG